MTALEARRKTIRREQYRMSPSGRHSTPVSWISHSDAVGVKEPQGLLWVRSINAKRVVVLSDINPLGSTGTRVAVKVGDTEVGSGGVGRDGPVHALIVADCVTSDFGQAGRGASARRTQRPLQRIGPHQQLVEDASVKKIDRQRAIAAAVD